MPAHVVGFEDSGHGALVSRWRQTVTIARSEPEGAALRPAPACRTRRPPPARQARAPASRRRSSRGGRRSPPRARARRGSGRGCGRRSRGPRSLRAVWRRCTTSRAQPSATSSGVSCGVERHQQLAVALRWPSPRARPAAPRPPRPSSSTGPSASSIVILPSRSSSCGEGVAVRRLEGLLAPPASACRSAARSWGRSGRTSWCTYSLRSAAQRISLTLSSSWRTIAVALDAPAARSSSAVTRVTAASGWRVLRPWTLRAAWPRRDDALHRRHRRQSSASSRRARLARPRASSRGGRSPAASAVLAAHQMPVQHLGHERRERRDQPGQRGQHLVEGLVGALLVASAASSPGPEAVAAAPDVPVGQVVEKLLEAARGLGDAVGVELRGDVSRSARRAAGGSSGRARAARRTAAPAASRPPAVEIGVDGEERQRVPQRQQELLRRLAHQPGREARGTAPGC